MPLREDNRMTLEDQLIQTMIDAYKKKGINLQAILDNPLFQGLPLAQKVKILESKAAEFSSDPKIKIKPLIEHTALSAAGGALAMAARGIVEKNPLYRASPWALSMGAILGGAIGAAASVPNMISSYRRDTATANAVKNNKYLDALVNRSASRPMGQLKPKFSLQSLVDLTEHKSYGRVYKQDIS